MIQLARLDEPRNEMMMSPLLPEPTLRVCVDASGRVDGSTYGWEVCGAAMDRRANRELRVPSRCTGATLVQPGAHNACMPVFELEKVLAVKEGSASVHGLQLQLETASRGQ